MDKTRLYALKARIAAFEADMALMEAMELKGGPGSGNWGHAGRKGKKGGSVSRGLAMSRTSGRDWQKRQASAVKDYLKKDIGVIKTEGGKILVQTPYDSNFVSELKNNIPSSARKWDAGRKVWIIDQQLGGKAAQDISKKYFNMLDGDKMSKSDVAKAKRQLGTKRVKASQKTILANKDEIQKRIDDLTSTIDGYSYSSNSRRKQEAITDRALLTYTLRDAVGKPEKMTDIQVRSLAKVAQMFED